MWSQLTECKPLHALGPLLLAGSLSGCAAYDAYQRCGIKGCAGDADITERVEASLHEHPVLAPPNLVYVQTLNHTVYLSGQVATDLQRAIAESAAATAVGADHVVDTIALTYDGC
jgi:osmotically-inducible protein OsmY